MWAVTCAIASAADWRAHPFGSSLRASWCWPPQTNAECRVPTVRQPAPKRRAVQPERLLSPANDQYFSRKAHPRLCRIGPERLRPLWRRLGQRLRWQRRQPLTQLYGHIAAQVPEILEGQWCVDGEAKQAFGHIPGAGCSYEAPQLAWRGETKGVRCIGRQFRLGREAIHNACQAGMKWIGVEMVPDCERHRPSRLQHSQHVAHAVDRRGKEHHAEATDHGVEVIVRKGQAVGAGNLEANVCQ